MKVEFAPWPYFEEDEIDAVTKVLKSGKVNYWTGNEVKTFEKEFAAYHGMPYGLAVANGTLALELALRVLGIGAGDDVIVTPRTFLASASSIVMQGARPIFADVDPHSQNITAETVKKVLTPNTKAIIAVHLAGYPCDMDPLMELAEEHGLKIIEDCAQSHGAEYKGKKVGSLGHIAAFSFCQDKIITTGGEGGMLLFHDEELWKKAWAFKDHGKNYDTVFHKEHPPGFRWLHESFGSNWRMTEMQAAIGRRQLQKLPDWLAKRRHHAKILEECFSKLPALRVTSPPDDIKHSYYKYYVFVRPERLKEGWDRDRIMNEISQHSIPCYSGSCSEVYLEKAFDGTGYRPENRLPIAKELGETSLMFLVHPTLNDAALKETCRVVIEILKAATK